MSYLINDIYSCIQGEGCMTGQAMALLRLQGCPVGCPFCDTKETWDPDPAYEVDSIEQALGTGPQWCHADADTITDYLTQSFPRMAWVLITGGEPAFQDLTPLTNALRHAGFLTALETSGTATGHLRCRPDWVCVSPKFNMPGGLPVLDHVLADADELKFVIGKQSDIDTALEVVSRLPPPALGKKRHVCLQPVSLNAKATELCVETVKRLGLRLSIQTHKLLAER
jgi:7-carboxy-7-deazaguanine synthase